MFEIEFPDNLIAIQKRLDDQWLNKIIKEMPFPIAYPLHRAREEGYPWHQVLKDLLHAVLHYMALLVVSEYVASQEEPDFDINEVIQERIGRNISEGHWLSFIRICVKKRGNKTTIPLLNEIFYALEEHNVVKMTDEELNINTGRVGLLSSWIKLRNASVHGPELSEKSKKEKMDGILKLVKSVLYLLKPLSQYHYCQRIKGKTFEGFFDLTGVEKFKELKFPEQLGKHQALLITTEKENRYLPLFPLYISYKGKKGIIIEDNEVYLINTIEKQKPSQYMSPAGSFASPKELKDHVVDYFNKKRMYEKRQDIKVAEVYTKGSERSRWIVEELAAKGLYIPDKYVERKEFERDIEAFLSSGKKAIIISGESGCGKTSSLIHWARNMLLNNELAYVLRCEGLPATALNPDKLERTLSEEMGYAGNFEEIFDWFDKKNKRFCLIFEGVNEFVGPGKDLGRFFESINTLLSRYRNKKCLKILISTTSETVPYFLNEQKVLPESMAEEKELYFHGEEGDIYGFRKFNEEELKAVANKYDVPYWAVEEVRKNKKIDLLNPRQFRIFAELFKTRTEEEVVEFKEKQIHQKIVNEMLKYSGYKLAGKHIHRVLRKDKTLLTILEEMARFMNKQKDLSPLWSQYEEKNPKLALMLKENNWEKLRKLKDLQLVKEERMTGEEGIGEWKLSFSHDKVYDFLTKKVGRRFFIYRLKIFRNLLVLSMILLLIILGTYNSGAPSKAFIDNIVKYNTQNLGPVSHASLRAYKELLTFVSVQNEKIFNQLLIRTSLLIFLFYIFLFFQGIVDIRNLIEKLIGRKPDSRIKYMYRDFVVKGTIKTVNKTFNFKNLFYIFISVLFFAQFTESLTPLIIVLLVLISNSYYAFSFLWRDFNIFLIESRSRSLFLYRSDKFAVKTNTILLLYRAISTGIIIIILYIFLNLIPWMYKQIDFEYLDGGKPAYMELIQKKWIWQESVGKINDEIKKKEDGIKNSSRTLRDLSRRFKLILLVLVVWIYYTLSLFIDIIHSFYLREKLGPYFR
jgi:hypothetical protein